MIFEFLSKGYFYILFHESDFLPDVSLRYLVVHFFEKQENEMIKPVKWLNL